MGCQEVNAFRDFERGGWESEGKAETYDAGWGPITSRVVDQLLDAAGVGRGTAVLDVATGPGYVAAAAADRGAGATGVDFAENMVKLARSRLPGIEFRAGDAERLPFAGASFDAVVGSFVLHHLGAPELAVAEAARVLKPGGRAAFTVWDTPDRARFMGVLLDAVAAAGAQAPSSIPAGPSFFRLADAAEFNRVLAGGGLARTEVRAIQFRQRFGSAGELWDCLVLGSVRLGAVVLAQPPEAKQAIRQEFERNLAAHAAEDGFELPVSVVLGAGVRSA